MKTTITRIKKTEFKKVLTALTWKKNTKNSLLEYIKMEIKNKRLYLSAYDIQTELKYSYDTDYAGEFEALLDPAAIKNYIELCADPYIDIDIVPNEAACNGNNITAPDPVSEYPAGPELVKREHCSPCNFSHITKAMQYVSKDIARPVLNAVNIENNTTVATDGKRLYKMNRVIQSGENKEFNCLIPENKTLFKRIEKTLTDPAAGFIMNFIGEFNTEYYELTNGNCIITGRRVAGNYPNYKQVIPPNFSFDFSIDKKEFKKLLKTHTKNIDFIFQLNSDKIIDPARNYEIEITPGRRGINGSGTDKFAFNANFLLDYIKNTKTDKILFEFNDKFAPCTLSNPQNQKEFYLIMPLRTAA